MSISTIRARVDTEIARRVGTWFTVREIQDKLKINPSTLKPLIMKYARENVLRRRHVKGTARSVEFSPASQSMMAFQELLLGAMPYRSAVTVREAQMATAKNTTKNMMKSAAKSTTKTMTKAATKVATKATPKSANSKSAPAMKKATPMKAAAKKAAKKSAKKAAPKAKKASKKK